MQHVWFPRTPLLLVANRAFIPAVEQLAVEVFQVWLQQLQVLLGCLVSAVV
jgi:hypothetical protein